MIVVTIALVIALALTRTAVVVLAVVAVAFFWLYELLMRDPMNRRRRGDDPAVSREDRWQGRDI
jgi:Sec-independent protein secretion pathway component TatC